MQRAGAALLGALATAGLAAEQPEDGGHGDGGTDGGEVQGGASGRLRALALVVLGLALGLAALAGLGQFAIAGVEDVAVAAVELVLGRDVADGAVQADVVVRAT